MPRFFKSEKFLLILLAGIILFGTGLKDARAEEFRLDTCSPLCSADPPGPLDALFILSVNLHSSSTGIIFDKYNGYSDPQWNPNQVRIGDAIILDRVLEGNFTSEGMRPPLPMDGGSYIRDGVTYSMGPPTGPLPGLASDNPSVVDCGGGGGGLDKFIKVARAIDIGGPGGPRGCIAKAVGFARVTVNLSGVTAQASLAVDATTYGPSLVDFSVFGTVTYLVEVIENVPVNEPPVAACSGVTNITSASADLNWTFSDAENDLWTFSLWEVASDASFVNLVDSDLVAGGVGTDTARNLSPETDYWWQVQVADDSGWSALTECPSFRTAAAQAQPLPQCIFFSNPSAIIFGQSSDLVWNCQNVSTCSIDQGVGAVTPPSGSVAVSPTRSTLYTLTCQGVGENASVSAQSSVDVIVFSPTRREVRP